MANIIFDWDGTIAKPDVAREASIRRFKTLGNSVSQKWLKKAQKTNEHYKLNKKLISKYTGITEERTLTIIMTDLFRFHYIAVVNEWKNKSLYAGMSEVIKKLAKKNRLVIASTLRQDLLEYSLKNLGFEKYFEKVFANTPDLKNSKEDVVKMAKKYLKKADFMIGDKEEDLLAGKSINAKTIYVTWGATDSDHKDKADFSVNFPKDILKIIK